MDQTGTNIVFLEGPAGRLVIHADDEVTQKLAMLFEGECLGLGPKKAAEKYGYTKQRYYQLFHAYEQGGSAALKSKKRGPRTNYVRTENAVTQVIRYRFLDPDANAAVIAQKMQQIGIKISQRSVERIIAEHGLQKKSFTSSAQKTKSKRLKSDVAKYEKKR